MVMPQNKPRTLIFSQRNVFRTALFRCALYEFENVISEIDSVDLLAPRVDVSTFRYSLARRLGHRVPIILPAAGEHVQLKANYDLFLAVCGWPTDLHTLKPVAN